MYFGYFLHAKSNTEESREGGKLSIASRFIVTWDYK